eukprot:TRINITY_DN1880_c0_g1_i1.p1 TRINITY_DN1880_c0_g1~~TRINITY_DN1880_c0_g1_i1.p1  ORF type:complete len:421 (+),score=126.05 TRINITY_DN1880_c0_g1_i1:244-1506(+)
MTSQHEGFDRTIPHDDSTEVAQQSTSKFSSVFLQRVTKSFPTISVFSDKAKNIYNSVKELNPVIKTSLETAESKLDEKVSVYRDVLVKVDSFGVRQLDKVEELAQHNPLDSLKAVNKEQVFSTVNTVISEKIVAPTTTIISQRIVTPASSLISNKINQALTVTERTVNNYVHEEPTQSESELNASVRVKNLTTKVSKHVKNRVLTNLQNANLRLRPQQKVEELKAHSVDLIKYFNENIATQSKSFVVTVQKKSAEKKEAVVNNGRKAVDTVKTTANNVKKQVTTRISRDFLTLSNLVFENINTIRLSERLTPYLLYASSFVTRIRPTNNENAKTTPDHAQALASVEQKLHHVELKINKHADGSSSFEIFVPLPSYSQIRLLISQQTLKLAVERMLELIAKAQHNLSTKKSTVVVEDVSDD